MFLRILAIAVLFINLTPVHASTGDANADASACSRTQLNEKLKNYLGSKDPDGRQPDLFWIHRAQDESVLNCSEKDAKMEKRVEKIQYACIGLGWSCSSDNDCPCNYRCVAGWGCGL